MGFFSSRDRVSASMGNFRLVQEATNVASDSVSDSIFNNKNITDNLLDSILGSLALKADSLMRYAISHSALGINQGKYEGHTLIDDATLATVTATEVGATYGVAINSAIKANLTPVLAISEYLINSRGFDGTNINNPPNAISGAGSVTISTASYNKSNHTVTVTYQAGTTSQYYPYYTTFSTYNETVSVDPTLILGMPYVVTQYQLLNSSGQVTSGFHWWFYYIKSNTHPSIITIESHSDPENTFFPVIPIRRDNQDLTASFLQHTTLYKTSKTLLKKIGIDINQLSSNLNQNPSIGDIDHAYVLFACDLETTSQAGMTYLFDFFNNFVASQVYTSTYMTMHTTATNNYRIINDVVYGFNYEIKFIVANKTISTGSIGKIGHVTKQYQYVPFPPPPVDSNGDPITPIGFGYHEQSLSPSQLIIKKQITATTYETITVSGLYCEYSITGSSYAYPISASILDLIDGDADHKFLIPLHYHIAKSIPTLTRNALYEECLIMHVESYQVTHVKWYQRGFFKVFVNVVSFALIVFSVGQSAWLTTLVTAINSGAWAIVASMILKAIAISLIVSYGMKFVVQALGLENSIIAAVVAIAVAAATHKYDKLAGFLKAYELPTAEHLLQGTYALIGAIENYTQEKITDIQNQFSNFTAESELKLKLLEDAEDLLGTKHQVDPFYFMNYQDKFTQVPNESPDSFYNRTIHNNNIGVLTKNVISNYTDYLLKLPEVGYV